MGHEFQIDVEDVHLFAGVEWFDLGDRCGHDCPHNALSVVAWGPDVAHYELNECDRCGCRAWRDGRCYQLRQVDPAGAAFWLAQQEWRHANPTPKFAADDTKERSDEG